MSKPAKNISYFASKGQLASIHILKAKIFSEKEYRNALMDIFGVESSKALTFYQASDFIKKLTNLADSNSHSGVASPKSAGVPSYYGKGRKGTQRHLTNAQAERIELLQNLLSWANGSVTKFIARQTKKNTAVPMLMNYQAVKVIVGMQKIYSERSNVAYEKLNKMSNKQLKEQLGNG